MSKNKKNQKNIQRIKTKNITTPNTKFDNQKITNFINSLDFCSFSIVSESALLTILQENIKGDIFSNIICYDKPRFLKVDGIEIILEQHNIIQPYPLKIINNIDKTKSSIIPIFIQEPPIMKLMYKSRSIKFKEVDSIFDININNIYDEFGFLIEHSNINLDFENYFYQEKFFINSKLKKQEKFIL